MEKQEPGFCRNCGHLLPPGANFCPVCSQKNTDGRLSFGELLHDFSSHLFNLDAKIFNTLGALVVPGKLTTQYFQGKHVPYYHPVRLFIVSGALFLTMLSIVTAKQNLSGMSDDWNHKQEQFQRHEHYRELAAIRDSLTPEFRQPAAAMAMDSLLSRFSGGRDFMREDTLYIPLTLQGIEMEGAGPEMVGIAEKDLLSLPEDSLAMKYGVNDFFERLFFIQQLRIQKSGDKFIFYLIGNVLWMMLVMMPMLALVLKLLYVRRKFFYFEHLVFSFHTHTFVFLILSVVIMFHRFLTDSVWVLALTGAAAYLYFSMKNFYGQGWVKTFAKFVLANWLYLFLFLFAFLLTVMASAVFY